MTALQAHDNTRPFALVPAAATSRRTDEPLVPPAYLEPPARDELPQFEREAAAVLLDRYLLRLSRYESVCRLRLGRLAAHLLDARGYHDLGFARLADYAIERLGLSGRELQSVARVWRAVDAIPRLAEAYRSGRVNWTKLRMLCEVVSEETVDDWITRAEAMSTRELAAHIKDSPGPPALRRHPPASVSDGEYEDADTIDGEPRAQIRIACPAHMRPLWRELAESASRSSGAVLSAWQALEAVCAEALSGAPSGAPRDHAVAVARGLSVARGLLAPDDSSRPHGDCKSEFEVLRQLIDGNTAADLELLALGDFSDRDTSDAAGDPSAVELDRALRAVTGSMQNIDWQLGCLLASFAGERLYRHIGYRCMGAYVSERLGISERKARSLVRLQAHPADGRGELAEAYRSGRLSWLRALIILPVLSEHTGAAWIKRAGQVTVRRLQDEVRWTTDMRDRTCGMLALKPPALGAALEFSCEEAKRQIRAHYPGQPTEGIGQPTSKTTTSLYFSGPASVIALFQDALRAYCDPEKPGEPAWEAFERILLHVKAQWEGVPRHRNPIHEREGWRCRVPACSSRRNLQEHHVIFRSRGGDNARSNRISICAWHHLRGIHTGIVRAHGDAEHAIHWRLGPRLRLRDDVYVSA